MREQRLLTSLLVSFTLHTAFLAFVPPLLSRPSSSLKRPLWVDLVELKEPSLLVPSPPRPESSPKAPQKAQERTPDRETVLDKRLDKRIDKPTPSEEEFPALSDPYPRPLPSARELIPTMNSLLSLQHARENPLYAEPLHEAGEGIHRGPQYEAYVGEVREAVDKNWKVSGDVGSEMSTTVLRFSINPDGSLASLDLLQSCGMILRDYEALEAIKQSFPLRSPPESLLDKNGKLSIRFYFHYLPDPPG